MVSLLSHDGTTNSIEENIDTQLKLLGVPLWKEIVGFLVFIIVFVGGVPYVLSKFNRTYLLLYYFSNLDLLANVLNHSKVYFDNLYYPSPLSEYSFWSSTAINFIALMGISTVVSIVSIKYKSVFYGLAASSSALLITFLLPTTLIYQAMTSIEDTLESQFKETGMYLKNLPNHISVLVGVILSFLCVYTEYTVSNNYLPTIAGYYKYVYESVSNINVLDVF